MYNFLINRIKIDEDAAPGMVGMATTQGNPSVDYLPGGFTTMRNMLNSLSPVKKQWKLEVLDEKEAGYVVKLEDALHIRVPKQAYEEFNQKVFNTSKDMIDLAEMLNEDVQTEVSANLQQVHKFLTFNVRKTPQVFQTSVLAEAWLRLFPNSTYLPTGNDVALNLHNYTQASTNLFNYVKTLYGADLGKLESLVEAFKTKSPLNQFPPFSSYEYLVGVLIKTDYQGVEFTLDLKVDTSFQPIQLLHVEDEEVLEELKAIGSLRATDTLLMPARFVFTPKDFTLIKKVADDTINR